MQIANSKHRPERMNCLIKLRTNNFAMDMSDVENGGDRQIRTCIPITVSTY